MKTFHEKTLRWIILTLSFGAIATIWIWPSWVNELKAYSYYDPPGPATLISPSGSISDTTPTYSWNAVSDSTWYRLLVWGSSGAVVQKWYPASQAGCSSGSGTCSVTPPTTLASGSYTWPPTTLASGSYTRPPTTLASGSYTRPPTTLASGSYTWWIQTYNTYGFGDWSAAMGFTVAGSGPILFWPTGTISSNPPPWYIWWEVSGATYYYLVVQNASGTWEILKWYTAEQANCNGSWCYVADNAANLASGAHTWYILAWGNNGYSPWSPGMSFSVP